jgi:hypothetical protein
MEAFGYSLTPTRAGLDGIIDKIVLIEEMGYKYAQNREVQDTVLKAISGAGSAADDQLKAWEKFLESLPYRREAGEILRKPTETIKHGGDCDDLTVLAIAGARAIGLPALAEVVADSKLNGFHVRALVGLPPLKPDFWVVLDPVCWSEPKWAMAEKNSTLASQRFHSVIHSGNLPNLSGTKKGTLVTPIKLLAGTLLGYLLLKKK